AEHREILGEEEDGAAVDGAPAGDDAVAGYLLRLHAEVGRAVLDEHVEFLEGAFIEEDVDALAGGELAAAMLGIDARLAAAHPGDLAAALEFLQHVLHGCLPRDRRSTAARGRKRRARTLHCCVATSSLLFSANWTICGGI